MVKFWYIKGDFLKERKKRIGASDIPGLIQNPENPTESLAGYGITPITLWQEKTGKKERDIAGLAAEMGHYLEPKTIELFIRNVKNNEDAIDYMHKRSIFNNSNSLTHEGWQPKEFKYETQYYRDSFIVHPDCIYVPSEKSTKEKKKKVFQGIEFNLSKPFLIEAKSANYWATKRPENSLIKGYDFENKTWHGIPLKHYFQIQFQLAIMELDIAYLALLSNTSDFHIWEVKANKEHINKIIDIAGRMAWHIEKDVPPKEFAINKNDIIALYPEVQKDFVYIDGKEAEKAINISKEYRQAEKQEKIWKKKKEDALDAMSVMLKDRSEINYLNNSIAKWTTRKGYEKIKSLKEIKDIDINAYKYLCKKNLITQTKDSRSVKINFKNEE